MKMISIAYLADCPQYLPTIARWIFEEWGYAYPGISLPKQEEIFSAYLQRNGLPLTLVALEEDKPVGTASLQPKDMSTRLDLSPWLACVFVPPEQRRKGIGGQVVMAAEDAAKRLGIATLYLFTPDQEKFYSRLGWDVLERTEYWNKQVVIMCRQLLRESRRS